MSNQVFGMHGLYCKTGVIKLVAPSCKMTHAMCKVLSKLLGTGGSTDTQRS